MATVTGFTAARMLIIENESIIDGSIVGDDLILEQRDGTLINAGVVQGRSVLNGTGVPGAGLGSNGDFYIANDTKLLYGPKAAGAWPAGVLMVGRTVLSGAGAPGAGLGVDGDFYINTTTSYIYGPKAAGAWPAGVSLVGPQGPQGNVGPQGPTGPAASFAGYEEPIDDRGNVSGTVNLDFNTYNHWRIVPTGNVTITFSNLPPAGYIQGGSIIVANSTYTITWPAGTKYPNATPPVLNGETFLSLLARSTHVTVGAAWSAVA